MTKTWRMDPQPGPEVTVVRDRYGVRWERDLRNAIWRGFIGHTDEDDNSCAVYREWPDLVARGPLTDASNEERS